MHVYIILAIGNSTNFKRTTSGRSDHEVARVSRPIEPNKVVTGH